VAYRKFSLVWKTTVPATDFHQKNGPQTNNFPYEIKCSRQCLSAALLEYSPQELPNLCLSPSPVAVACEDGHLLLVPRSREAWPSSALGHLPPLLLTLPQSAGVSSSGGAGSSPLLRAMHHILCLHSDSPPVLPSSTCASPLASAQGTQPLWSPLSPVCLHPQSPLIL